MDPNEVVNAMENIRCTIQRGEATTYPGGVEQLLFDGEQTIIDLGRKLEQSEKARNEYENLFREEKHECAILRRESDESKGDFRTLMRVVEHFLDE